MQIKLNIASVALMAASFAACYGQADSIKPAVKKHTAAKKVQATPPVEVKKARTPAGPSVEEQIQTLRTELEKQASQIESLQTGLAEKDAQLKKAQQAAADAQASAARAEAAATAQQQAVTENSAAVTTLQTTVTGLKGSQDSLAASVSDETAKIKTELANPIALHYKGIVITPGGFMEGDTVYRQKATGADLPTAIAAIPFNGANSASLSEFYGSGRSSRITLLVEGKTEKVTYRGYMEGDFFGVGTNSNNNQSGSYVLRQRAVWLQAALKNGYTIQAGQMWSLVAERAVGLSNFSADVKTPNTIDPNYVPGFVWSRQYGLATIKNGKRVSYGFSIENAQTVAGGSACPAGSCLFGGSTTGVQPSSFNALNATYSYNLGPDLVGKVAFDPGWGHYEAFAIGRFPHYQYYPNYALGGAAGAAGSYSITLPTGGFGGSLRGPVFGKYGVAGLSGLFGWGVGRYGDSALADVTFDATGHMKALTNASALSSVEIRPTPRLLLFAYFGEDFAGRLDALAAGPNAGYGLLNANNSGCNVVSAPPTGGSVPSASPANCTGNNKFVQELNTGFWYDIYKGPAGRLRYGMQYGYLNRAIWGGSSTPQANATENQFYTGMRYNLP